MMLISIKSLEIIFNHIIIETPDVSYYTMRDIINEVLEAEDMRFSITVDGIIIKEEEL